jgi:hypothetical protein
MECSLFLKTVVIVEFSSNIIHEMNWGDQEHEKHYIVKDLGDHRNPTNSSLVNSMLLCKLFADIKY